MAKEFSKQKNQKELTEKIFDDIIRLSAQPVQATSQKGKRKKSGGYSDKQTHQGKPADTSD